MSTDTATLASPTFTLEEVAVHFEDWRRQKQRGERIPEQLWSEAIALLEADGLSQVTRRQSTPGSLELIRPGGRRLRIEPGDGIEPRAVLERFMEVG